MAKKLIAKDEEKYITLNRNLSMIRQIFILYLTQSLQVNSLKDTLHETMLSFIPLS